MSRLLMFLAFLLAVALPLAGHAEEATASLSGQVQREAYKVGVGDVLKISVYDEASLSGTYPVDDGGYLDLPLLGRVQVDGFTADQISDRLTELLAADYLVDPQVSVSMQTYGSKWVQVLGAVRNPGAYPLSGPTTVLDMLAQAGGVTEKSSREVQVKRARTGEIPPLVINLERLLTSSEGNVMLQDGDLVYVPESVYVYVAGEVSKPGAVAWRDGLTVTQAITAAGGASPTADLRKVYMLRDGNRVQINVKRIIRGREPDLAVRAGDQIHVDRSVF